VNKTGPSSTIGPILNATMDFTLCTPKNQNKIYDQEASKYPREIKGNPSPNSDAASRPLNMKGNDTQVEERVPESPID
jgi:hypothetical protein